MKFVYKPEGLTPREWDFEPRRLMSPEVMAIEKLTKLTFDEWQTAILRGSVTALHALLWVLLKREQPTLVASQVQFAIDEIGMEPTDDELRLAMDKLLETPDAELSDEQREALVELKAQFAEADSDRGDEAEPAEADAPKE